MSNSLVEGLRWQAMACGHMGAAFSSAILKHAAADAAEGGIVADILAGWTDLPKDRQIRDAVALRLLASLHYLVLAGLSADLAQAYPPNAFDPDRAWEVALSAMARHRERLTAMQAHEPQTNEVRRSACLLGGFLAIADQTRLPLRCFEVGASAGLNSLWNEFRYDINDGHWGDPASPVVLPCQWDGSHPSLDISMPVAERHACDRRPVRLDDGDEALRLLSYCWAGQRERFERLQSAIELAQRAGLDVDDEAASTWVRRAAPVAGRTTVLFHSVVYQYMPPDEQAAFVAAIKAHGAAADRNAPFAWLRMEMHETEKRYELKLRLWPTGEDRVLAVVHPHGEKATWQLGTS